MSSTITFIGASYRLLSVAAIDGNAVLRVKFSASPLQVSAGGTYDALNVSYYSLSGPSPVSINTVAVGGDTTAVYLNLSVALTPGFWTLTVGDIRTPVGTGLAAPLSYQFEIKGLRRSALNAGSTNDDAEEIIRKHLNPGLEQWETGWSALIKGLSAGDNINFANAKLAFDQLFKSTASGIYLDRRSADDGIIRPEGVGIGDDVFRRLSVKTTTKKIITQALLEVLEVYYGVDSTRAHLVAAAAEPYDLQSGWELLVSVDGESTITIPFSSSDFVQVSAASAREVAAVITRWLKANGSSAYAIEHQDTETGDMMPIIYSGSLGLKSSVQILGGRAQNVFRFPTLQTLAVPGNNWSVSKPSPGVARYTRLGATTTDLTLVAPGDYVNVFGPGFSAGNRGTFTITDVDVRYSGIFLQQWFEIKNDAAVTQATVPIVNADDMAFFAAKKAGINDNGSRAVVVAQTRPQQIDVQLPATTVAVTRGPTTGAYLQPPEELAVASLKRLSSGLVTVTTSVAHGLSVGSQVLISGVTPSPDVPATIPGNGTSTTDARLTTLWSPTAASDGSQVADAEICPIYSTGLGAALITGGIIVGGTPDASAVRFNINSVATLPGGQRQYTYSWTACADLPAAFYAHRQTAVPDDADTKLSVLVTGGFDAINPALNTTYIYDVLANTWTPGPTMTEGRQYHSQVGLDSGQILIMGGYDEVGVAIRSSVDLYTHGAGTIDAKTSMSLGRYNAAAILLSTGKVLICGGYTDLSYTVPTRRCELYDPNSDTWEDTSDMTWARAEHQLVDIGDGQYMVVGGRGKVATSADSVTNIQVTEIYDAVHGRWYSGPRTGATRADTKVALTGTQLFVTGSGTAEKMDLATRTWSRAATPGEGVRSLAAATTIADMPFVYGGSVDGGSTYLATGALMVRDSDSLSSGGLQGVFRVTSVPSGTSFTVQTPEELSYSLNDGTATTVIPMRQQPALAGLPGPYLWSPDEGPAITGVTTLLTEALNSGTQYRVLKVTTNSALDFPDEPGYLVLDFGGAHQLTPVKYLGRANASQLLLDYRQQFPEDLPVGTSVTLLLQKGPLNPENPISLGSFYLTDSSAGRIAAQQSLDSITAAGITLRTSIVYPGDRGLGGEGLGSTGTKFSDKVAVWAGNDVDAELAAIREEG